MTIKSGSGEGSESLVAIVVHIDLLGDSAKTEMVGNHKGIHKVIFGQIWIGFLEFFDLLGIEDMDLPLETGSGCHPPGGHTQGCSRR